MNYSPVSQPPEAVANEITEKIIGCAIEVHRHLGPGLLESIYEKALCSELEEAGIAFKYQEPVPVVYKGKELGQLRLDLLVEHEVVVELKAVDRTDPLFEAQLLSYMRLCHKNVGLLINFNVRKMTEGIRRFVI
ncbi:MAG: GxxExxY protein [Chitinivibrionales bacterium]|nr:GxxExxY protein [Chitinivibrionales bacterium]